MDGQNFGGKTLQYFGGKLQNFGGKKDLEKFQFLVLTKIWEGIKMCWIQIKIVISRFPSFFLLFAWSWSWSWRDDDDDDDRERYSTAARQWAMN